jgi:hypothetical protein
MVMVFNQASKLREEIAELFSQEYTKHELLSALASRLQKYPELKNTPFHAIISNHIVEQAEEECEIMIHEDEINQLWETCI